MWNQYQFSSFDILNGSTGESFPMLADANRWLARARKLIDSLSDEKLTETCAYIELGYELLEQKDGTQQIYELAEVSSNEFDPNLCVPVQSLLTLQARMAVEFFDFDEHITWSNIFALVGLNHIAAAVNADKRHRHPDYSGEHLSEFEHLGWALHSMLPAMEIIARAEFEAVKATVTESIPIEVNRKLSNQKRAAALKGHQKKNKLKDTFIQWYLEHQNAGVFHSRNQAADKFYKQLEASERLFTQTNYKRTLTEALGNYLKAQPI